MLPLAGFKLIDVFTVYLVDSDSDAMLRKYPPNISVH
jgi:hypothetical protein